MLLTKLLFWRGGTALLSGIVQAAGAPVLGFVMNFVPHPVISGFTSAGGLIIAMSQVGKKNPFYMLLTKPLCC